MRLALVPKTNPAKCWSTRDLYVGNRRGKTQGWITQPKQWDIHLKICINSHHPTLICSQKSFNDKKEQGCTYPSLPDVVGRRLNLFRSTSLSPGDSRAPGPILPPLRSSWNSAVSWAAQKVSKHLIKKYAIYAFAPNTAGLLRTPAWLGRPGAYWDPYSAVSGVSQMILNMQRQAFCHLMHTTNKT